MAITYQSAGAVASTTTSTLSVAYPSGISAGHLLVLVVGMKPSSAGAGGPPSGISGWTTQERALNKGGYGTTLGADTGNTHLAVYTRTADGSESGSLSVSLTANNVAWGVMFRLTTSSSVLAFAAGQGEDTNGNSSFTGSTTDWPSGETITGGDAVVMAGCVPTDAISGFGSAGYGLSGGDDTLSNVTEIADYESSSGNDIGGFVAFANVDSGEPSYPPGVITAVGGVTTNARGPFIILRIREVAVTATASQNVGSFSQSATATALVGLSAAQQVGAFTQTASVSPVAGLSAAQTVGAFTQTASASPVSGLSAAQQVGSFDQTATVTTENAASLSATQPVGAFTQSASVAVVASASAAQAVGQFTQSAAAGAVASAAATQAVGGFAQAANIAADAGVSASQLVGDFGQVAALAADDTATIIAAQAVGPFGQAAALTVDLSLQAGQPVEAFGQAVQAIVLPVAGLSAAQTVAGFGQSVQVDAGEAPANLEAAQQIGGFVQQATAQALVAAAADQAIGPFGQEARLITVTVNASADQQVGDFGQAAELGALPFVMGYLVAQVSARPAIRGAVAGTPSVGATARFALALKGERRVTNER